MTRKQAAQKKSVQAMLKKAKEDAKTPSDANNNNNNQKKAVAATKKSTQQQQQKKQQQQTKKKKQQAAATPGGLSVVEQVELEEQLEKMTPQFNYETHLKREKLYVQVQLHHVPENMIDITKTTDKRLVIDTTRWTKKLKLDWPFPDGMVCDSANAEFELQKGGVLMCTFPIKSMPESEAKRITGIIDVRRASKKVRFERGVDKKTGLETRTKVRDFNLAASEKLLAEMQQKQKEKIARQQEYEQERQQEANEQDVAAREHQKKQQTPKQQQVKQATKAKFQQNQTTTTAAAVSATSASGSQQQQKQQTSKNNSNFASDADIQRIAAQVSTQAKIHHKEQTQRSRMMAAKAAQKQEQKQSSSQRKKEVLRQSFQDVLKQKKEAMKQKAEMIRPAEPKKKTAGGKSVKFASS